jgi:hypothetical protein
MTIFALNWLQNHPGFERLPRDLLQKSRPAAIGCTA